MCGRFTLTNPNAVAKRYGIKIMPELKPRYNISPGQIVPVITNADQKHFSLAKWGLIPHWAKDEKIGYKMINARAETLLSKPAYRDPIRHKRCLIPADGFYEWQKQGKHKIPYRLVLKNNGIFSFAGIYDLWQDNLTFSIITLPANKLVSPIHDRMPAILTPDQEKVWLSDLPAEALTETILKPLPANLMSAYKISTLVNSPEHDNPEIIKQV